MSCWRPDLCDLNKVRNNTRVPGEIVQGLVDQSFKRNQIFSVHFQKTSQCDRETVRSKRKNKEQPMSSRRVLLFRCSENPSPQTQRGALRLLLVHFQIKSVPWIFKLYPNVWPPSVPHQDILHAAVKMQKKPYIFCTAVGRKNSVGCVLVVFCFLFFFVGHHIIWGWEHEVQSQAPGSGVSSGRCVAAPCA